ncbi:MAG: hypothetical protein PXY39_07475 [archaeon]|nr:hypothetical protein [archaeon]
MWKGLWNGTASMFEDAGFKRVASIRTSKWIMWRENLLRMGKIMAQVTKVDDRGRIKLSKELAEPGSSVVIIDAQTYFLGIPIEPNPVQASGSWMKTKESIKTLKKIAEDEASKDAIAKAKRRKPK